MNIVLNGEPRTLTQGTRLTELVRELGLEGKRLAVEINREIIPRSQYAQTDLKNGDTIEIVHPLAVAEPDRLRLYSIMYKHVWRTLLRDEKPNHFTMDEYLRTF